jgi:hypothetical protein
MARSLRSLYGTELLAYAICQKRLTAELLFFLPTCENGGREAVLFGEIRDYRRYCVDQSSLGGPRSEPGRERWTNDSRR